MTEQPPLSFRNGVTLVGGAPFAKDDLRDAVARAPHIVCADSGADRLPFGTPEAIVGDLDSLADPDAWRARLGDRVIRIEEQDSTDLEKCLRQVDAPFFVAVGFVAGRVDHLLAALHALIGDARPIFLIGEADIHFSAGAGFAMRASPGARVSFFPLRRATAGASAGLRWPLDGLELEAGGKIATSNEALGGEVAVAFDRPGVIVSLPRDMLDDALSVFHARSVFAPDETG